MLIQEIPFASALYEQTKSLRENILRLPLGLKLSEEDLQGEGRQFHVAAIESDATVVGIVVFKPLSTKIIKLRQMAVRSTLQGQGIGKDLVRFAENLARSKGFQNIETTARVSAKSFYEQLGYQPTGDIFTEVTIPVIKMIKSI